MAMHGKDHQMYEKIELTVENQQEYEMTKKTGTQIMDDIENLFCLGDKPKNKTTPNGTVME